MRKLTKDELIPANALHSIDGTVFMPILNPEETVGQRAAGFSRGFYVIESAVAELPDYDPLDFAE